ncbi:dTDP-4-amino-4,6-dideoxygalactose transaminase [Luteimonas saliphila]|uniref:dTDP-4-amino-4,6-dideoxygalactose transaminase n=1 Tax=Luteimonas saliphila TaxID=2804919 RepID=UPI00192E0CF6|nr:dTDP-4-amino-4,6-dideoxygalactose transaminase [Luteimonas saliphila]
MIPFNRPYTTGRELTYIEEACRNMHLSGDGVFTRKCHHLLERDIGSCKALLTHSCTASLEMAALLLNLAQGDEVIMPSYTFVSTANAFVLRGAVPVFVDIREDTLNLDENLIEAAITPRTKAICVVHYAGVACEMDAIMAVAGKYGLAVVEDAAQGIRSSYRGKPLGSIGTLGCLSFHETKNAISGEGGALLINDARLVDRAEIIREKGTNRSRFFRGQIDKYTWIDVGSSYLPSELTAAFLLAQLEDIEELTRRRLSIWTAYHEWAAEHEASGLVRRPIIPTHCGHNAHLYYLLLPSLSRRQAFIASMKESGVLAVFHYVPLHSTPAGMKYGRAHGSLDVTNRISDRLVRLPLWVGIESQFDTVLAACDKGLADAASEQVAD